VDLTFGNAVEVILNIDLCSGGSVVVAGEVFDGQRPTGRIVLKNGSVFGCDSIVNVRLRFIAGAVTDLEPTLCFGDSIVINGKTYNLENRTGREIVGKANAGCDSVINISLSFYSEAISKRDTTLTIGQSWIFGGIEYDANNPTGVQVISTVNGCDSTIYINIKTDPTRRISVPNVMRTDGTIPFVTVYGGPEILEIERFQVFTRWGDEIFIRSGFAPNVPELGWDGLQRGKNLNPGVYVYQAIVRFVDGKSVVYSGDITLLR
jgi:hypothetical protein